MNLVCVKEMTNMKYAYLVSVKHNSEREKDTYIALSKKLPENLFREFLPIYLALMAIVGI